MTAGDFMGASKRFKEIVPAKARKNEFLILSKKVVAIIVTKQQDVKTHYEDKE